MNLTRPIKITDTEAIAAAIAAAEGRARERCVSAERLTDFAAEAESRLAALPKRLWKGTVVVWRPAGPWARSYKWTAYGTEVIMLRRSNGWVLTAAERVPVGGHADEMTVTLPGTVDAQEVIARVLAHTGLALARECSVTAEAA